MTRLYFNPPPPHGERQGGYPERLRRNEFQSTLPAWGATESPVIINPVVQFQSTLPAWGATSRMCRDTVRHCISIHAPRMGSDHYLMGMSKFRNISIHAPRMGSDKQQMIDMMSSFISIHAPRMGSDLRLGRDSNTMCYFNPRSPHGERLGYPFRNRRPTIFQSTLPAWGATQVKDYLRIPYEISIHAPRMGSDMPPTKMPSDVY